MFTFQFYSHSFGNNPPYPADGLTFLDGMVNSLINNSPAGWDYGYVPAFYFFHSYSMITIVHTPITSMIAYRTVSHSIPNISSCNLTHPIGQQLYFGAHYARLHDLKNTYDPRGLFTFPTGIQGDVVPAPTEVSIHPNGNTNKCLDVRAATYANGTPVQMFVYFEVIWV